MIFRALAAALVAFVIVPVNPAGAADLRLFNSGFDEGLDGWSGSHAVGGVLAVAWKGQTAAQVKDDSEEKSYGRESRPGLPATAGVRYTARAKVWVESGTADLYLRFRDAGGVLITSAAATSVSGKEWNEVTVSGVAPAGTATVAALIYSGVPNVSTAYWDEVLISAASTDLGVQLESRVPNGTTFADGKAYAVYTGTAAANPRLAVIDLAQEKVLDVITIPDSAAYPTVGGWAATTATDGSVYLGTYPQAKVYRHVPGQSTVTDLGKAESGTSLIWDLEAGARGEVYGGTSDDGRYFKYHKGTFTTLLAPAAPKAEYVRSLAHDPAADVTYLGTGTNAGLIRYDNATARRESLLPAAYANNSMVGGLTWTGGRLFAWLDSKLLVLDIVRNPDGSHHAVVDAAIAGASLHHSPAENGKVWFVKDDLLHSYDIATKSVQAMTVRPGLDATGYTWTNGTLVALGSADGDTKVFKYTPSTGRSSTRTVPGVPALPAAINALGAGPDGKIYTGGYLTGGTGVYDPMRGDGDDSRPDSATFIGLSQTDSMLNHNGKLYFGTYPSAKLSSYEPGSWPPVLHHTGGSVGSKDDDCEPGKGPPPQDRPYALAGGPDGTVYMGTVPKYGKRSGALTVWREGAATQTFCGVRDQAVVALAHAGGKIFGGTSTRGALGATPVYAEGSASLFSYNASTGVVPHPLPSSLAGVKAVTALTEVDGQVWGLAGGSLLTLDPAKPDAIVVKRLFPDPDYLAKPTLAWRDGVLLTLQKDSAHVYGTLGDSIFRINRTTKAMTVLLTAPGLDGLTADRRGDLYYKVGDRLHRLIAR